MLQEEGMLQNAREGARRSDRIIAQRLGEHVRERRRALGPGPRARGAQYAQPGKQGQGRGPQAGGRDKSRGHSRDSDWPTPGREVKNTPNILALSITPQGAPWENATCPFKGWRSVPSFPNSPL